MNADDRAVTAPIEYVLTIAIAAILISGILIAATNTVGDQRSRTMEAQMDVVAQQVAGSLEKADRLVRADQDDDPNQLRVRTELPDEVLGNGYRVDIESSEVRVESAITDRTVRVPFDTDVSVDATTVRGGAIDIVWDGSSDELEVEQ